MNLRPPSDPSDASLADWWPQHVEDRRRLADPALARQRLLDQMAERARKEAEDRRWPK